MSACCWPCRSRKAGSAGSRAGTPLPSPAKPAKPPKPNKPPTIRVSEAPEYGDGNPRNKCALQPGHSLMDWIRLGNSGRDLAGTGGRMRAVTPKELAAHNQQANAWIAIRGRVYNISEYMNYHPGGPDELLRGAGQDATKLFDQVHAWVNYESLLSKCLIGPLKNSDISDEEFKKILFGDSTASPKSQDKQVLTKSMESLKSSGDNQSQSKDSNTFNLQNESDLANKSSSESSLNVNESKSSDRTFSNSSTVKVVDINVIISEDTSDEFSISKFKYPTLTLTKADSSKSGASENANDKYDSSPKRALPKFDWIQKTDSLTLIFYTKPLCNAQCCVSLTKGDEHCLLIKLSYEFNTYQFDIILENLINWPCSVSANHETGKLEIHLQKEKSKIWNSYGLTRSSEILEQSIIISDNSLQYSVLDKLNINHNTALILIKCMKDEYITFPIGYHSRVFYCVEDLLSRSYTTVPPCMVAEFRPARWTPDAICLMVKKYEQGEASTWLTSREVGDEVTISRPLGSFQLNMMQDASQFFLIAAGTGLTPMLSVIQFALQRRNPRCKRIDLLFFNRSEKDILWHDQLSALSNKDERFNLTNILSAPSSTWEGQRGHINQAVLISHFSKVYHEQLDTSRSGPSPLKSNLDRLLKTLHKELYLCICGPTAFTTLTKTLLSGLGCKDEQVYCFVG